LRIPVRSRDVAAEPIRPLSGLSTRDELPAVLNERALLGVAVEVGVQEGRFSAHFLSRWRGQRLTSIDPWRQQDETYEDVANVPQHVHDLFHRRATARLAPFGGRSCIWRMTSEEAAANIAAGSLDFAYLDARHDYESVTLDLQSWFGKIRPGGILAGHDYLDGRLPQGVFGVKTAVDEFCGARELRVDTTQDDFPFVSWIVEIPSQDDARKKASCRPTD